ncbi:hypothetical protein SRABI112_03176 [Pseudomonas mediterranea]|nr:hypothetical protein SRABI112_03176 [Pseudomonas mediterranea]
MNCIMCYTEAMKKRIRQDVAVMDLTLSVHSRPVRYFQ